MKLDGGKKQMKRGQRSIIAVDTISSPSTTKIVVDFSRMDKKGKLYSTMYRFR
jgi:hypothetical protein